MEQLTAAIFERYFTDDPEKRFFLCSCNSWQAVATSVQPLSKYFGLLLVDDATEITSDAMAEIAEVMQEKGLAYLCAWGGDCRRVEDIFDEVYVERELDGKVQVGRTDTLMTTSHPEESLLGAVWFFAHCAWPTKHFASDCKDWIVVVVADRESESKVRDNIVEIISRKEN